MGILISVIIPVYNGKQYIRQCLISIKKQKICMEVIIVDDGSTDGLEDDIENIRKQTGVDFIYIKNEKNLGIAKSRRIGIENASGTHIAFLDVDDMWCDEKTAKQIKMIVAGYEFTYTGRRNLYEDGSYVDVPTLGKSDYVTLLKENPITCSSVIITKSLAMLVSEIDVENVCDDFIMWLRVAKNYCSAKGINEPLVIYRVHKDSQSGNKLKHSIRRYRTYRVMGIKRWNSLCLSASYAVTKVLERLKWEKKIPQ